MIRFAKTITGNRIFIDNTNDTDVYYCEECNSKLVAKKGNYRKHHFAHKIDEKSNAYQKACANKNSKEYEMSEWHKNYQNRFPLEIQEYVLKNDKGEMCRADVYLEKIKTVIEFQHSFISNKDFERRNKFYNGLGIKVIWLFDFNSLAYGKLKWVHPDNYNSFVKEQINSAKVKWNEKQDAYYIDKETYINMFGYWKAQDNRNVKVHFVQTIKEYEFFKEIRMVAGKFDNSYPTLLLFVANSNIFEQSHNI